MASSPTTTQLVYTARIDCIDHQRLAAKIGELRDDFDYSTIFLGHKNTVEKGLRNALSLKNTGLLNLYRTQIISAVEEHWPKILTTLGMKNFLPYKNDLSCVAYENGGFFKRHRDIIPTSFFPRRLTWIYYFFKEPKDFEGGELVFYNGCKEQICITPFSGQLVAFCPRAEHEATTVTVRNSDFKSSRFSFTCFVTGYPSLPDIARSTIHQFDARLPMARCVTRPFMKIVRNTIRARHKNN